jgi:twitching motility protein PilT
MTIKEIFKIAVEKNASDIHLVVGLPPVLRIDGDLFDLDKQKPLTNKILEQMITSIITPEQQERFKKEKDLDFSLAYEDGSRFRVNLHYEKNNFGLVARVIPRQIPTLKDIGMSDSIFSLLHMKQGLILVTGPTGCGKSTTLAAMIDYLNQTFRYNIITLEDPIEYIFSSQKSIIIQRQLGTDMVSFAEGLKHCLRQDPNVIMVGEMRDLETIATTITLAETGHLVLATLHTYNAAQTIDRIIDIFPPYQQNQVRAQLSSILISVISQRLLPKLGGGRVATREIMINTPAIANMIRESKIAQIKSALETGAKDGMVTFERDLQKLVKEGLVNEEVAKDYLSRMAI